MRMVEEGIQQQQPSRKSNILDLIFCEFINTISVYDTFISDHRMIVVEYAGIYLYHKCVHHVPPKNPSKTKMSKFHSEKDLDA